MQTLNLNIAGVPTTVKSCGTTPEDVFHGASITDVVVIIPGNPGIVSFYDTFLKTLHEQLSYPVWIVGHAGHDVPKNDRATENLPPLETNENLYGLRGQVYHKMYFINTYIPKDARIHFIGHSIGSYIILQLLKNEQIKSKTAEAYFLFPTIEHMAATKNGKFLTNIVFNLIWLLSLFFFFLSFVPDFMKRFLIRTFFLLTKGTTSFDCEPVMDLVQYRTLSMVLHMARDEINSVKDRDNKVLLDNKDIVKLYYGPDDLWAPRDFYEKLRKDLPEVDAELCQKNYQHAFVLKDSISVGNMVAQWIKRSKV